MTRAQARVLVTNFGMHTVAPPATAVVRAASPSCPNAGEAQEFTSVCGSSGDCWLSLWTPRRITMKRRPLFYNGCKQGGRQWRTDRGVRSRAALRWRPVWRALERLRLAVRRSRRQRQERARPDRRRVRRRPPGSRLRPLPCPMADAAKPDCRRDRRHSGGAPG